MRRSLLLAAGGLLAAVLAAAPGAYAQDVEMRGEHYGIRPPAGYYEVLREDPDAYRPLRGFNPSLQPDPTAGGGVGPARVIAPPSGPATGTYRFPLLLGLYAGSGEPASPFTRDELHAYYFAGPNPDGATITEYFDEMSVGRAAVLGETMGWVRSSESRSEVAGNSNGLRREDGVYEFIVDLLDQLDDGSIDWGAFDNDGADGVPNSGDDDGYVDLLAVMHPTQGAECTGAQDDVWSHFWQLSSAAESSKGQAGGYATSTISASTGQPVMIDDYTIVPSRDCANEGVMEIGTLNHEVGHALGLPDLYSIGNPSVGGIGRWGLMGSGSWGCSAANVPAKPCGMTGWTRAVLGWAEVVELEGGADHGVLTLDPVQTSNTVYRVDAGDGSGDYYLLENRQALGFDADVPSPGLLVWRIDAEQVQSSWTGNRVNSTRTRMGVWLQQADGEDDLARSGGGRGDAGDPFPGSTGNDAFHASSVPASFSHLGNSAGVTLLDIRESGQQISFRLLSRYQRITLRTEGTLGEGEFFSIDGGGTTGDVVTFDSAPFQVHQIEAAGGELLEEGFRTGFIEWNDGSARIRSWETGLEDAELTAVYGNPEVRFDVTFESPVEGISPGTLDFTPDSELGWLRLGEDVSILAVPQTGFEFVEWGGALDGQPNPAALNLTEPASASVRFEVIMEATADPEALTFEAATTQEITLLVENATEPLEWQLVQGAVPPGMFFLDGAITGSARDFGSYPLVIRVTDAIGLSVEAELTLTVERPSVGLLQMAAPFLGEGSPSAELRSFLDFQGNRNGSYDLADFRSYVLDNPDAPRDAAAAFVTPDPIRVPLRVRREGGR